MNAPNSIIGDIPSPLPIASERLFTPEWRLLLMPGGAPERPRRVVIESPYAGNVELNLRYLRACMHDALVEHNEAPYASHGLYTQPGVLDDGDPEERGLGIESGFAWRDVADATIVYTDLGISVGMQRGIDHARQQGKPVELRMLGGVWKMTTALGKPLGESSEWMWPRRAFEQITRFCTSFWGRS